MPDRDWGEKVRAETTPGTWWTLKCIEDGYPADISEERYREMRPYIQEREDSLRLSGRTIQAGYHRSVLTELDRRYGIAGETHA